MTNINTKKFLDNFSDYFYQAVLFHEPVLVSTHEGNAVLMGEDEYNSLKETLYLLSVPGMKVRLTEGISTPVEECEEFEW